MTPAEVVKRRGGRAPARKCGRTGRQSRKPCGRGAGWGTSHPGYGACKLHGGSTPTGIKAAAREAAGDFARGMLGAEIDGDPAEALLEAVRLARGATMYHRLQVAGATGATDDEVPTALVEAYERAVERQARIAKTAVDAGIDERRVRAVEQAADRIVAAAEHAIAVLQLPPAERTRFAQEFGRRLAELEDGSGDVEGEAVDVG